MNYTTKVIVKYWRVHHTDEFIVFYRYYRREPEKRNWERPNTKGGKTEVTIQVFDEHGDPVIKFTGIANCSLRDNFCYRIGREIAFGRALKQLDEWRDKNVVASIHDNL